jgi:hypothetical protein
VANTWLALTISVATMSVVVLCVFIWPALSTYLLRSNFAAA